MVRPPLDVITAPKPTVVSLAVEGMSCGACAARIERRLNELDGVTAEVNFAAERVSLHLGDTSADLQRVMAAVETLGYGVRQLDEPKPSGETEHRDVVLGRRLLVAFALFMPLCDASIIFSVTPKLRFFGWQWLLAALALPVVTWAAAPFHKAALVATVHKTATMDTLVSLGIVAATGWSIEAMFAGPHVVAAAVLPGLHRALGAIYLDVGAGITTAQLGGRYLEARLRRRTGSALRVLAGLAPSRVTVLRDDGTEAERAVGLLEVGDRFVLRNGTNVPADGEVLSGRGSLDLSPITGESRPCPARAGTVVSAGSRCTGGRLVVRATRVGADTDLSAMIRIVERAQNGKAAAQRFADRVAGRFVPAVIAISGLTLAGWLLIGHSSPAFALNAAVSVLVVACPCALGLATPAALVAATGVGARLGIYFTDYRALETSSAIDTVVLDKTGTLTTGEMGVDDVWPVADRSRVLQLACLLEEVSEHPVGRAIVAEARRQGVGSDPTGAVAVPRAEVAVELLEGGGVSGAVDGQVLTVRPGALARTGYDTCGTTTVSVCCDGEEIGRISLSDQTRPSARRAIAELRELGVQVILLTGDAQGTARAVGRSIGLRPDEIVADVRATAKAELIASLQEQGHAVAMVGDGVNDGPALATADLGIALGSGTDVARNAAALLILRDDLRCIAQAITLARRSRATIRSNLLWAFAYNLAVVPIAVAGLLDPVIASLAMACSSGFVIWNSWRLGGAFPADGQPCGAARSGPIQ